jgi:HK97 family phage portal protein
MIFGPRESRSIAGSDTWIRTPSLAGVVVTEETAVGFGAIYACISVLASDVSAVPFQVVRRDPGGGRSVDLSHPVHDLICHCPDSELSALGWIGAQTWHLNTHGNAYAKVVRDRYLRPAELVLLDPRKVRPARSHDGRLYYEVQGEVVLPEDMLHVANVGFDGIVGKSPIRECMQTIGLGMATEAFGASYYGNGTNHKGILTTPNTLDEVESDNLRKEINEQHQGPYLANRFMLLQGGMTFTPTTIPADEAQFIATRKFQLEEICRIFRVPPSKVMNLDRANFANLEEVNLDYYDSSLKPWIRRFEVELIRKLFTREERRIYTVEHDVSSLLKGRVLDQANADKIYREMGVLNADEIRARKGQPPIVGGKVYLVPLNFAPLDKVEAAPIEVLKGANATPVRSFDPPSSAEPAPSEAVRSLDPPTSEGATLAGLRGAMVDAARPVVLDTGRRMAVREANILKRIFRTEDLGELCLALDAHFEAEAVTLSRSLAPSLDLYSLAMGEPIDPAAFAARSIASARDAIRVCIEGPSTRASLTALVDRWEQDCSEAIAALLPGSANP